MYLLNNSFLVCPICHSDLQQLDTSLFCTSIHYFPIARRVPRFVNSGYAGSFGLQWNKFRKTQLDSYTGTSISKNRLINSLTPDLFKRIPMACVLEVGCGAGRFTEVLLKQNARIVSIDLSTAVDANALNFPVTDNHMVIQANGSNLPFKEGEFDFVICLGVLQHTPSPETTVKDLFRVVKPGGWLIIDHYGKNIKWYLRSAPLFRFFLKQFNPNTSFKIVSAIYHGSLRFFQFSNNRIHRKICNVIFPIVFFDKEFPDLPDWAKKEWGLLDTYDSLTDRYKHRRSVNQIKTCLQELDLEDIQVENQNGTIVARGRKK